MWIERVLRRDEVFGPDAFVGTHATWFRSRMFGS